ncbi:MAG: DNA methyltransferase [bacterium]
MENEIPNKLICGDNLEELKKIPPESVDLIYIDPPFFSNKQYEVVWGDEAEVRSFEDRWEGGVEHYIGWLRPRVEAMYETLKPTGSFYLHCDWHANAHIRIMLDDVFGAKNFQNEIIWQRTSARSDSKRINHIHDMIFLYIMGENPIWNKQYTSYSPEYTKRFYRHVDSETGRRFRVSDLTAAGTRQGESGQQWRGINPTGVGRHWAVPQMAFTAIGLEKANKTVQEMLDILDARGFIFWPKKKNGVPGFKRYLDEMPGTPLQSIWSDIPPIGAQAAERMGYPTQKPETLLERIIKSSSNEGDVVSDAFCGCGTACVVAARLKRKWIGIDISPTAIKLIEKRLAAVNVEKDRDYVSIGSPNTIAELKALKPFEFQNWVVDEMSAKHSKRKVGDMGIDGYMDKDLFREAAGIQVKQSESIGRNVVDNFQAALNRAKYKKGYIVAFSFGRGAIEEAARLKNAGDVDIELVRVEDLLYKKVTLK